MTATAPALPPAPWSFSYDGGAWVIRDRDGRDVAEITQKQDRGPAVAVAVARLLAAAPELLSTLERILQCDRAGAIEEADWTKAIQAGIDAVAKARTRT